MSQEEKPLAIGDTAPDLLNLKWVKGNPTNIGGKLTLVECWATWCGPCLRTIPHLTELQKKYSNELQIIGISQEDEETVSPFVENMGDQMSYRVAVAPDEVYNAYMEGIPGIPHSFLINTKKELIWHSHPMEIDAILDGYIKGKITEENLKQIAVKKEEYNASLEILQSGQFENPNPIVEKMIDVGLSLLYLTPDNSDILRTLFYMTTAIGRPDLFESICKGVDKTKFSTQNLASYLDNALLEYVGRSSIALNYSIDWLNFLSSKEENPYILSLCARFLYTIGLLDRAIDTLKKASTLSGDDSSFEGQLSFYNLYKEAQGKIKF